MDVERGNQLDRVAFAELVARVCDKSLLYLTPRKRTYTVSQQVPCPEKIQRHSEVGNGSRESRDSSQHCGINLGTHSSHVAFNTLGTVKIAVPMPSPKPMSISTSDPFCQVLMVVCCFRYWGTPPNAAIHSQVLEGPTGKTYHDLNTSCV